MAQQSFEWTKRHASKKSKAYMEKLPIEISFECDGMPAYFAEKLRRGA